MNKPEITVEEAQEMTDTLRKAPRITKEAIEAKISKVDFHYQGQLTICVLTMTNGFMQVGKAAPASPANYIKEVGDRFAYEDAFKGLWHLEGYLLCEKLMEEANQRKMHAT